MDTSACGINLETKKKKKKLVGLVSSVRNSPNMDFEMEEEGQKILNNPHFQGYNPSKRINPTAQRRNVENFVTVTLAEIISSYKILRATLSLT